MMKKKVMVVLALATVLGTGPISGVRTLAANQKVNTNASRENGQEKDEASNVSDGIKHVYIPKIVISSIRPVNPDTSSIRPVNPDNSSITPVNPIDPDIPEITPAGPDKDNLDVNDPSSTSQSDEIAMYRLYNPNSGEHFYTANIREKNNLDAIGWNYEGIGWYAPTQANGIPVYRLYNKNGGEHHYTVVTSERKRLLRLGWKDEGIGWYSYENQGANARRMPKAGAVPLYRQYNSNAFANNHNYTTSIAENNYLVSLGWRTEGHAFRCCGIIISKKMRSSCKELLFFI